MDREGFSKRLAHALDLNHVGRAAIERKPVQFTPDGASA